MLVRSTEFQRIEWFLFLGEMVKATVVESRSYLYQSQTRNAGHNFLSVLDNSYCLRVLSFQSLHFLIKELLDLLYRLWIILTMQSQQFFLQFSIKLKKIQNTNNDFSNNSRRHSLTLWQCRRWQFPKRHRLKLILSYERNVSEEEN